jgi:hypothetical protein
MRDGSLTAHAIVSAPTRRISGGGVDPSGGRSDGTVVLPLDMTPIVAAHNHLQTADKLLIDKLYLAAEMSPP